jgi:hypothetical protein
LGKIKDIKMDEDIGLASIIGTVLIMTIVGLLTCLICCIQKKPENNNNPNQNLQNLQYRSDIPIALAAYPEDITDEEWYIPEPEPEPQSINLKPTSTDMRNLRANESLLEKIKYTKPFDRIRWSGRD